MSKRRIVPYLTVKGAAAAIEFYEKAFDAEEISRMMAQDGVRVMHAELEINDSTIMLADEFPEFDPDSSAPSDGSSSKSNVAIHLDFKKAKEVDRGIEQAAEAGATVLMPAQDVFWGARYGRVRDPFGHIWAFHAPLKKKHGNKPELDAS